MLSIVASNALAVAVLTLTDSDTDSLFVLAAAQIGLWAALVGTPIFATRRKGSRSLLVDFGLEARAKDACALALGVLCQLTLIPAIYLVVEAAVGDLDVDGPARQLADRASGPGYFVLAGLVVGVAPVVEELFYRGLMLRAAVNRLGPAGGVVLTSLVFGGSHFQLVQLPGLFAFGVVLAVLAVRTGRLGSSIVTHIGFNVVTMVVLSAGRL